MFTRIASAIFLTVLIFHVVAFAVYVPWSMMNGLEPSAAGDSPGMFMLSVLVQKVGHSITFVLLFYVARETFSQRWFTYAVLWWIFSAFGEFGEAMISLYSLEEAILGVIAEAIYFPIAAIMTKRLIGVKNNDA